MIYILAGALILAVVASDWFLASRIRKAVAADRLGTSTLQHTSSGGSPLGIIFNVFRWRKILDVNDLSDPDHIAIRRHYLAHAFLVTVVEVMVILGALLNFVV